MHVKRMVRGAGAVAVLIGFSLLSPRAVAANPPAGLSAELRFLETLEPAGQALCTDPELEEMHGSCRVWIDQDGRYHYFLMLRRGNPWKVWRVPTEGNQQPEVRWRAAEGCPDDAVCT